MARAPLRCRLYYISFLTSSEDPRDDQGGIHKFAVCCRCLRSLSLANGTCDFCVNDAKTCIYGQKAVLTVPQIYQRPASTILADSLLQLSDIPLEHETLSKPSSSPISGFSTVERTYT